MKKTALVIMAAGIGSRFGGGIKQLEPVGPNGEIIMDYSIHDALEAGFDRIIFVIRHDLEEDFKEVIGNRIEKIAPVTYAFQELSDVPEGFSVPADRKKPWGTGQAILSIRGLVEEPFLVINADDYYGKEVFRKIHTYMVEQMDVNAPVYDICMGGFILANTLSENGGVTRGVCEVGDFKTRNRNLQYPEDSGRHDGDGQRGESGFGSGEPACIDEYVGTHTGLCGGAGKRISRVSCGAERGRREVGVPASDDHRSDDPRRARKGETSGDARLLVWCDLP